MELTEEDIKNEILEVTLDQFPAEQVQGSFQNIFFIRKSRIIAGDIQGSRQTCHKFFQNLIPIPNTKFQLNLREILGFKKYPCEICGILRNFLRNS